MDEIKNRPCQICGSLKNKGIYLQVECCRACSVFFRRAIEEQKTYVCQQNTQNCTLDTKSGRLCRYCRFKKCQKVGLQLEYMPKSNVKIMEQDNKYVADLELVEIKIHEIFNENCNINEDKLNLQTLLEGFDMFMKEINPKNPVIILKEFDFSSHVKYIEKFMLELAKLINYHCKNFGVLPAREKFLLYKNTASAFYHIERMYSSCVYFGMYSKDFFILHDELTALDYKIEDSYKNSSPYDYDYFETKNGLKPISRDWNHVKDKMLFQLLQPMRSMFINNFEIVYILAQMLWNVQEVKDLSPRTIQIGEELSEQLSHELHNYYNKELCLTNYAHRIIRLTKLIDTAKEIREEVKELTTMSRIFELFHLETVGTSLIKEGGN